MTLEDHLGDTHPPKRARRRTSQPQLPQSAAGVSETELADLENSGKPCPHLDFATLAKAIGLHAKKLERIALGWIPLPSDIGQWRELRIISTTRGGNTVNCYLVWDEVTREAASCSTPAGTQRQFWSSSKRMRFS